MERMFFAIGSISAFLGVAAGAFGAHGLKNRLTSEMLEIFEVGVRYQMYHAFGLLVTAWSITQWPQGHGVTAGWLFVVGTIIFSGSLYVLSISGIRSFGAVTPLGGLAFLAGWIYLVRTVWQ
tara:strand:- start:327 stop:692 length:366 start_codon:yes stop_codon:yes gene_type:complete